MLNTSFALKFTIHVNWDANEVFLASLPLIPSQMDFFALYLPWANLCKSNFSFSDYDLSFCLCINITCNIEDDVGQALGYKGFIF